MDKIRNFCIIAHIDHGKSTLADRMLELTHTVEKRDMKEQILDQMDLERERGITIKLTPVRMEHQGHILNLIDTPGHVDFSYEVSRSLAAVEGAILLVDASQGIEAQTLSTLYAAIEHDLTIIPVLNKIDLPAARPDEVKHEIIKLLGCDESEIILASGKTGEGVDKILESVIDRIPAPKGSASENLKAIIFDSVYDPYRGVVAYLRVMDGEIKSGDEIFLMQTKSGGRAEEVGIFRPKLISRSPLSAGEIGYLVTGFREVS
ncbi:MAG TPA: GTP-binding protein, partial [bacterium]|nr:GTP-binding protein [bacterium]